MVPYVGRPRQHGHVSKLPYRRGGRDLTHDQRVGGAALAARVTVAERAQAIHIAQELGEVDDVQPHLVIGVGRDLAAEELDAGGLPQSRRFAEEAVRSPLCADSLLGGHGPTVALAISICKLPAL